MDWTWLEKIAQGIGTVLESLGGIFTEAGEYLLSLFH